MKRIIYSLILLVATISLHAQTETNYINESQADFESRMQWFNDAGYPPEQLHLSFPKIPMIF